MVKQYIWKKYEGVCGFILIKRLLLFVNASLFIPHKE